ncbi:MAG: PAS domain S-box protein [Elusimicrobiales bacterium]|jgi:PAS domain S-box-containing protein
MSHITVVKKVYLIVGVFVGLILTLMMVFRFQMDTSAAIRSYVGGEGLWAKAQKDAVSALEHYSVSHDEADYQEYLRMIQVQLGDKKARMELQKALPDFNAVREGFLQGRNHPDDVEPAIRFFRRFQRSEYMSEVITLWNYGDSVMEELMEIAEAMHREISSGGAGQKNMRAINSRLKTINRRLAKEEDQFSFVLASASRRVNDISQKVIYFISFLFAALGTFFSLKIIRRIRYIEDALVDSEERYRTIFESVNDIIYTIESDGTISSISPSCAQISGWRPDELTGKPFGPLIHPDDLSLAQEIFRKGMSGEAVPVVSVRILTKSAKYIYTEITVVPVYMGGKTAILGVLRDVTARRQAEERLQENEERLNTILETVQTGILTVDSATREITDANLVAVNLIGLPKERVIGSAYDKYIKTGSLKDGLPSYSGGAIDNFEGTLATSGGDALNIIANSTPVAFGGREHVLMSFVNITSLRRAEAQLSESEAQLRHAQKMDAVGRLAGGIAHDFNNILSAILGYVGLLQKSLAPDDARNSDLNEMRSAAERAAGLTRHLLAFSRRQILTPRILNLNTIIVNVEKIMRRLIGENYELNFLPDPVLKNVKADSYQIEQVVLNILINSRDAMPEGGTITIETHNVRLGARTNDGPVIIKPGDYAQIRISDTGDGMDKDTLSHIFEPFFTTKRPGKGTGLGLSTAYGIVKQSNGYIFVDSEPGRGTTARIYLPSVDSAVEETHKEAPRAETPRGTALILLAEDEDQVRNVMARILEGNGYQVLATCNGDEALKACLERGEEIQLLITDLIMPKMGGMELAGNVKKAYPHIKVICTSGYTDDTGLINTGLAPGTQFLQKPVTADALLSKVNEILK